MEATREKLVTDIKTLLADAEALFRQAAEGSGQQAQELRRRAEAALEQARARLGTIQDDFVRRARDTAYVTDEWVHHNPWSSIGLGAGLGLLIGFLIARR